MRDITFRVYDTKHNKIMDYGKQVFFTSEGELVFRPFDSHYIDSYPSNEGENLQDRYKIMQSIGMRDSANKKMHEGDILKTNNGNYVIEYDAPAWNLFKGENDRYDNGDYYEGGNVISHNWSSFTIIGNIYENPEFVPVTYSK